MGKTMRRRARELDWDEKMPSSARFINPHGVTGGYLLGLMTRAKQAEDDYIAAIRHQTVNPEARDRYSLTMRAYGICEAIALCIHDQTVEQPDIDPKKLIDELGAENRAAILEAEDLEHPNHRSAIAADIGAFCAKMSKDEQPFLLPDTHAHAA